MTDRDGPTLTPEAITAYFTLMEVSSLLEHQVLQQLRDDGGLSYVQFQILATLHAAPNEQRRMTELADGIVHSRSGLTYQASRLEEAGLVTRQPSREDERGTTLTLTPAGRDLLERVMPGHIEVVHNALGAPLSPDDLATLTGALGRVRDRLRAAPPRSATPRVRRNR